MLTGPASQPLLSSDSTAATLWFWDVCAWVPSLESDWWMSSPTCGHTASCRAYALPVFEDGYCSLMLSPSGKWMAGVGWGGVGLGCGGGGVGGAVQASGGRQSGRERGQSQSSATVLLVDIATGGQINFPCPCVCEKNIYLFTIAFLREKLIPGGSQPWPTANQDRTGVNLISLAMNYFAQQYFHTKP